MKRKAWWLVATFLFGACILRHGGGCFERPLRVGTYNIEQFGNAEDEASAAGKVVATRDLACSEYWQPGRSAEDPRATGKLEVSLLDHVVAPPGFVKWRSVEVHSFCKELRCKSTNEKPIDYENVSDHCPVTFDVAR